MASITANKLIMQNPNVNIKLYTFGCPRVFSKGHNVMTNVESYRVFHKCDPVSMLGPFPYTHGNLGINVGDSNVMRPSHHSMDNYISKCSSGKAWNNLAIATDNHYIEDGLSWMFRQLQKFLMYAVTISAGGAIIGALNIADALYALMQTGMKISKAIASLIRQMAKYVYNGWESAKAKASQSYYETKPIMLHIIDLFLQKVRQVASQAIDLGNRIAGAGVDATRRILPIIGQNVAMSMGMPVPVIFYL